jgi:hypothetical protein
MTIPRDASRQLDETLARLDREHLLVIELGDLAHLLVGPDTEPFIAQRSPAQPGIDDLAATLVTAKTLPDELTVRVILPPGTSPDGRATAVEAAFRSRATYLASAAWRDAMAVRSMGLRQLPLGLVVALFSAVIAYAAGFAAKSADVGLAMGVLIVVAGLAITVAWVVSWMVVETTYFDWRQDGRKAAAYELLARCTLEIT